MICNINYYDETNDQYILKNVALATKKPVVIKSLTEKNIVNFILNNFNNDVEEFSNKKKNNLNIIILIILIFFIINILYNSI